MKAILTIVTVLLIQTLNAQEREIELKFENLSESLSKNKVASIVEYETTYLSDKKSKKHKYNFSPNGFLIQIIKPYHQIDYKRDSSGRYRLKRLSRIDSSLAVISSQNWVLEFDSIGRVIREYILRNQEGPDTMRINEMKYDSDGRLLEQVSQFIASKRKWANDYDDKGRIERQREYGFKDEEFNLIKDTQYEYFDKGGNSCYTRLILNPLDTFSLEKFTFKDEVLTTSELTMKAGSERIEKGIEKITWKREYNYLENGLLKDITMYSANGSDQVLKTIVFEYEYR